MTLYDINMPEQGRGVVETWLAISFLPRKSIYVLLMICIRKIVKRRKEVMEEEVDEGEYKELIG